MRLLRGLVLALAVSGTISAMVGASAVAIAQDGLVLVANIDQPISLNREQVRNLYMGGKTGVRLKPVALSAKHRNRIIFNTKVIGLTESRIRSYWAQMRFTGRGKPPPEFDDIDALIAHLQVTPGSVGYVSVGLALPAELRVLYHTAP